MLASSENWFIHSATQALEGINVRIDPSLKSFVTEVGNLAGMDLVCIQFAYYVEPDPLTPEILIARAPFTRPEAFVENLLACAGRGWLDQDAGHFRLTEAGRQTVNKLCDFCNESFSQIKALSAPEMEHLLALLNKVTDTVKSIPEPLEKPAFTLCLCFGRGISHSPLAQIRRRILDLLAFWDDVHLSVWLPIEPEGQLWEVFTLVWRGQAQNAAELASQLVCRHYVETDYAATLERLVVRGWLVRWGENYMVHPQAARMRQQVEETTERRFDAAFINLSEVELMELKGLMTKFAQSVQMRKIPMS